MTTHEQRVAMSNSFASGAIDTLHLEDRRAQAPTDRTLTTTFLATRAVVGLMRTAGYGRIINVSSVSGAVAAHAGDVAYPAAKAGIVGLTRMTLKPTCTK